MRFLVYVLCGVLLAPTVWASDTAPSTKNGQVNTEEFHISPAYLPDHQIGESGPLVMDTTERKTTRYSNVDAVNSAINAVAVSNINNDMHTNGKAWMKRTTVALSFQKDWKPLYSAETVQPIGHYDDQSRQVWFTQGSVARAADVGTTLNSGFGYRHQ
ncbi:MAG: inverse autotransporter beta domain-containing protein [Veillonella sp.]